MNSHRVRPHPPSYDEFLRRRYDRAKGRQSCCKCVLLWLLFIFVVLLILAAAGVLIWHFVFKDHDKSVPSIFSKTTTVTVSVVTGSSTTENTVSSPTSTVTIPPETSTVSSTTTTVPTTTSISSPNVHIVNTIKLGQGVDESARLVPSLQSDGSYLLYNPVNNNAHYLFKNGSQNGNTINLQLDKRDFYKCSECILYYLNDVCSGGGMDPCTDSNTIYCCTRCSSSRVQFCNVFGNDNINGVTPFLSGVEVFQQKHNETPYFIGYSKKMVNGIGTQTQLQAQQFLSSVAQKPITAIFTPSVNYGVEFDTLTTLAKTSTLNENSWDELFWKVYASQEGNLASIHVFANGFGVENQRNFDAPVQASSLEIGLSRRNVTETIQVTLFDKTSKQVLAFWNGRDNHSNLVTVWASPYITYVYTAPTGEIYIGEKFSSLSSQVTVFTID